MDLTKRQRKLFKDFYDRHKPKTFGKFLGMEFPQAAHLSQGAASNIFSEIPNIGEKRFEKMMLERLPILRDLQAEHTTRLKNYYNRQKRLHGALAFPIQREEDVSHFVVNFFTMSGKLGIPFDEQIRTFRLNSRFAFHWGKRGEVSVADGKYFLTPQVAKDYTHEDAPLFFLIFKKDHGVLGTVGGYLFYDKGRAAFRITNIQGIPFRPHLREKESLKKKRRRAHIRLYHELSRDLGENWRVYFAREIARVAGKKMRSVVGVLPRRFYRADGTPFVSNAEYRRQREQLAQTYDNAGFVAQPDKTWRFDPKKKRWRRKT